LNKLVLKPGREKSLKRRHPWVFSGAVAKLTGEPEVTRVGNLLPTPRRQVTTVKKQVAAGVLARRQRDMQEFWWRGRQIA
jgi:23S rRNA (cytosine1962-C5)-methyltransferase